LVFFFIVFYFIFSLPWSVFFFFFHCWLPILSSPVDNLLLIYIFLDSQRAHKSFDTGDRGEIKRDGVRSVTKTSPEF
jgi:hypothetical protein